MLPNAMPVNSSSIVYQVVFDHDFCRLLTMHLLDVHAQEIPISSPQQASNVIAISATSWYLFDDRLTNPRTRVCAIEDFASVVHNTIWC